MELIECDRSGKFTDMMPADVRSGRLFSLDDVPVLKHEELLVERDSDTGDNITVRDYLRILLSTLWKEGEGFSGKRPFGNSGWDFELCEPLVKGGFIPGTFDEDGELVTFDYRFANQYVQGLIMVAFYGVESLKSED